MANISRDDKNYQRQAKLRLVVEKSSTQLTTQNWFHQSKQNAAAVLGLKNGGHNFMWGHVPGTLTSN